MQNIVTRSLTREEIDDLIGRIRLNRLLKTELRNYLGALHNGVVVKSPIQLASRKLTQSMSSKIVAFLNNAENFFECAAVPQSSSEST